jgi:2-methylisocitrate lyase-like PEP mutase family enzyme
MTPPTQLEKARLFQQLHIRPGAFLIPNPWDAGSARLLASLGFEALATTSAGLAFSLGRPDGEGQVSREEALLNVSSIVDAVTLPVSADLENGFTDQPEEVGETILLAAATGLVGASIEDATSKPAHPIYDFSLAVDRIRAAAEAAHNLPFPFTLTARAENYLHGHPNLDDTIRRLQAYAEAGADVLFAPGLPDLQSIRAACTSVSRPVNVLASVGPYAPSVKALEEAGVKRISLGSAFSRLALSALHSAAQQILTSGSFESLNGVIPYSAMNNLMRP